MDFEPPIQNLDAIDLLGKRVDGGVDLAITCSGPLDESADTLRRIKQKIVGYLDEIRTPQFQEKFGSPERVKVRILLYCPHSVSSVAQGLINVLAKEAASSGVEFILDASDA